MASETNIVKPGFTRCSEIYYGSLPIAQVYKGGTLIWQKTSGPTYSIIDPTRDAGLSSYTPTSDVTLDTYTTYAPTSSIAFNYNFAIYQADGTFVYHTNSTSGLTIITAQDTITVDTITFYKHVQDFAGAGPSLTSGVTYYIFLGQTYTGSDKRLSIDGDTSGSWGDTYEWEIAGDNISAGNMVITPSVTMYSEVTTL